MSHEPVRVLVVSTANASRSILAEALRQPAEGVRQLVSVAGPMRAAVAS